MTVLAHARPPTVPPPLRGLRLEAAWDADAGQLFVWGRMDAPDERGSPARTASMEAVRADILGSKRGRAASRRLSFPRTKARVVPGVELAPLDCLAILPKLSKGNAKVGASLDAWASGARLALEFIARQRFVPALTRKGEQTSARWVPFLSDVRDAERVAILARSAPGSALLLSETDADPHDQVLDYVSALVDAGVRDACAGLVFRSPRSALPGTRHFVSTLVESSGALDIGERQASKLDAAVSLWNAPARKAPSGVCAAFRLDPPSGGQEPGIHVPGPRDLWTLSYHLQALDDPSLLVPASSAWADDEATRPTFTRRGVRDPQERLLEALGHAARLVPAVEKSLREAAPEGCILSAKDAERFFQDAAPALSEVGIRVLLPGLKPLEQALRARLKVKQTRRRTGKAGDAKFGAADVFEFEYSVALGDEDLSEAEFKALCDLRAPLVRVRGQWVALNPGDVEKARALWAQRRKKGTLLDALQATAADEVAGVPLEISLDGRASLDHLLAGTPRPNDAPASPPAGLNATLRPYQARGLAWLLTMRRLGVGALLADDMGLGKTVQVLALLQHAKEQRTTTQGPSLVVCPASVAGNWRREASRFTPGLRVLLHHGPDRGAPGEFARLARDHDLVITTYALLPRDIEQLKGVRWDTVILDEAQNVKNPAAKQARAARALPGAHRVAMTGTPVENHLGELWSIFQFLNPGYLGSSEAFREGLQVPIERYADLRAEARLRRLIEPFMLRRAKTDPGVAPDLPSKFEMKVHVNLTREQASLYEAVVRDGLARIDASEGLKRRGVVLATLTKLKQVCDHPAHFLSDGSALRERSGKLSRLVSMLEEALEEGGCALVFTQFREMGDLLRPYLEDRFGEEIPFLHGGTPRATRDEMVARFQADGGPRVFLLSLKAGGVGLNLTRASHVFHYDRWWNPAVEDQATDRAYRIGQRKNVQVCKLVCIGTIEERIDEMLEEKKGLAGRIVGTGERWITEMSTSDIKDLFALRPDAVSWDEGGA
ncbi:MAG: DEAD/DEAH box helicase [Candidatus Thermoplasmatota archaeon]